MKKRFLLILPLLLTLALSGCGKDNDNTSEDNVSSSQPPVIVEKTIGEAGGSISDTNGVVEINIPAGALSQETNIVVEYLPTADQISESPQYNFLCGVKFGPSGTVFEKPVEVSLQVKESPKYSSLSTFYYEDDYDCWNYVTESSFKNGKATFNITHFSTYQVLNITPDMYLKYVDLVYEAFLDGKPDSWVSSSYKDYLINEKHVMDYYQESGGLYYEPCGLFVYGKYYLNGKEGDQEELYIKVGESNKVGNKYGVSNVGGLLKSKQDYDNARKTANENTQIIDVTVIIDYKIIKPNITCKASKTKLQKGDTATVDVYCHYVKPTNTIYPDFPLPYYKLTLSQNLSHLKLDKKELTTNSEGRSNFEVTSKDGKSETVKVIFDVSGEFGTHAEGSVSFGEEKVQFNIDIHIHEVHEEEYRIGETASNSTESTTSTNGTYSISVDYDMSGTIEQDSRGNTYGVISVSNVSLETSSTAASLIYVMDYAEGTQTWHTDSQTTFEVFSGSNNAVTNELSNIKFRVISYGEDGQLATIDYSNSQDFPQAFISADSTGYQSYHSYKYDTDSAYDSVFEDTQSGTDTFACSIYFEYDYTIPLFWYANQKLEAGTLVYELDGIKDMGTTYFYSIDSPRNMYGVDGSSKTTEVITLS